MAPGRISLDGMHALTSGCFAEPTMTISTMHYGGNFYSKEDDKFDLKEKRRIKQEAEGIKKARQTFARLKSKRKKK